MSIIKKTNKVLREFVFLDTHGSGCLYHPVNPIEASQGLKEFSRESIENILDDSAS